MTNAELEEVICGLHRRIALTTAGTPLQDDLIKAVGALRIAIKRISELEAQLPKEGEWIENDNGTYSCNRCGSWIPNEQHFYARYCLYCGAKMRENRNE